MPSRELGTGEHASPMPGFPEGTRFVWDSRARLDKHGEFVLGGAPWGLVHLKEPAREVARNLRDASPSGHVPQGEVERHVADLLLRRGIIHPLTMPRTARDQVTVIVPAHDRLDLLERCLRHLDGLQVIVVDDASHDANGVQRLTDANGARLVRHTVNQGPGAARNTGLVHTNTEFVAFLDSDCVPETGWIDELLPHFDHPATGAVGPRVLPHQNNSTLGRFEQAHSALDMGPLPQLVTHGAPLGFLPTAALVVRRQALDAVGVFDPSMRVGEDVDLIWRLIDHGWLIRYDPGVRVWHTSRVQPHEWAKRRYEYGTSAADLDQRHPSRLTPVRVSGWNLAVIALALSRNPIGATTVAGVATVLLASRLREVAASGLATRLIVKGLLADTLALGSALRREWWPVGWMCLLLACRSRVARAATASMLTPIVLETVKTRPNVAPPLYALLRLAEDAAYGCGVLTSALRTRRPGPLRPSIQLPFVQPTRPR